MSIFQTLSSYFPFVQFGFMGADIILIAVFAYLFVAAQEFRPDLYPRRPAPRSTTLSRAVLREQWDEIKAKFQDGTPEGRKLAIIEADKFVDYILKESGFQGEHMADRLERLAPHNLASFERLWRAHKIRNEIVHAVGYDVSESLGKQTLADYEAFLTEVRILY